MLLILLLVAVLVAGLAVWVREISRDLDDPLIRKSADPRKNPPLISWGLSFLQGQRPGS